MLDVGFLVHVGIIVILLLASSFFSASETGLTAASSARIHKLKTGGNKHAITIIKLRKDKEGLIGAILLGNNVVNILASAIATSLAIHTWGDEGVIYATFVMTILVLLFGEVIPKTYAFYNAEKVSIFVAPIMYLFVRIVWPITFIVQKLAAILMVMLRLKKEDQSVVSGMEELRGAIDLHHAEGSVEKEGRDMLSSILDLKRVEVKDVMVHRKYITSINIDQPVKDIVQEVLDNQYTRIPLWRDKPENIVGILHAKAVLTALRNYSGHLEDLNIQKIAVLPWFVPETNTLANQLLQFRKRRTHLALVVNEYGDLVGLVTLEDILEEIVGDIEDEHDVHPTGIKRTPKKGTYDVNGETTIRDLNRELGWHLPEKNATTIAGFLIHELKYIPEEAEEGKVGGLAYKVLKKKDNQVLKLRLRKAIKPRSKISHP